MSVEYTWKVTSVKYKDETNSEGLVLPNAVVQTNWMLKGVDEDGCEGSFAGATPFTAANVSVDSFVPLNKLTEQTVLGWIQSVVVDGYLEHVKEQIQKEIDDQHENVLEETSLPWATE